MLILVYLRGDIMINIYYTDSDNGNTKLVKDYIKGSWINMISPSEEEIKEVCDNLNIKDDFIKYSLDYEEKARIDIEDDGTMLFIVDIPIIEKVCFIIFSYKVLIKIQKPLSRFLFIALIEVSNYILFISHFVTK